MNYIPVLDSEEWLNKSGGLSRQQKEAFLLPYRSYRDAMRTGLQPILDRYPLLTAYAEPAAGSHEPPILLFLAQMQHIFEAKELPPEEKLEAELNLAFQRMLENDLQDWPEEEESVIRSLPDVMAALEKWQGNDKDKFKLLQLYSRRREITKQLESFQEPCTEIGRKCLNLVQERFEICMQELKKPETIPAFLEKAGIGRGEKYHGQITPVVLPCNKCLIQIRTLRENPGHYELKLHMGIEVLGLYDSQKETSLHDENLLSRIKALGDPARLKILRQLAERPCYLQEMAGVLGLTPATVLHHLSILMGAELIGMQMTPGKKKVYYQLKKQGLEEVSREILQLTLSREERESRLKQQLREGRLPGGDINTYFRKKG